MSRLINPNGGPPGSSPQIVVAAPLNDLQLVCQMAAMILAAPHRTETPETATQAAMETYMHVIAHMHAGNAQRYLTAARAAAGLTDARDAAPEAEPVPPARPPLEIA